MPINDYSLPVTGPAAARLASREAHEAAIQAQIQNIWNEIYQTGSLGWLTPVNVPTTNDAWVGTIRAEFEAVVDQVASLFLVIPQVDNAGPVSLRIDTATTPGTRRDVRDPAGAPLVAGEVKGGQALILRRSVGGEGGVGTYRIVSHVLGKDVRAIQAELAALAARVTPDALDLASATPRPIRTFYTAQRQPGPTPVLMGGNGVPLLETDDAGRPVIRARRAFFTGAGQAQTAIVGESGVSALAFDKFGRRVEPARKAFHTGPNQPAISLVTPQGNTLMAWDADGTIVGQQTIATPNSGDMPLLPRLAGSVLYAVGAEDRLAFDLTGYTIAGVYPGGAKAVRAVIDKPGLGANTSVSTAPGLGRIIPDAPDALHVFGGAGQSLAGGSQSGTSLVTVNNPWPEDALMLDTGISSDVRIGQPFGGTIPALSGGVISGFRPLVARRSSLSAHGETPMEGQALWLSNRARSIGLRYRSVSFVTGRGGSSYVELKKGTAPYENFLVALEAAADLAVARGWSIIVDHMALSWGESGQNSSTVFDDLLEWQDDYETDIKAVTGQVADVPFVMSQPGGFLNVWPDIPEATLAILRAHDESPKHWLAGPQYQFGMHLQDDQQHFKGPGYRRIGEMYGRAAERVLWTPAGTTPVLRATSAVLTGSTVAVTYSVPVAPLVFDTTLVPERDVKGFRVVDDGDDIAITSATITDTGMDGTGVVSLALAAAPTGTAHVLYALSPQSDPRTVADRPRGNLRDSAADVGHLGTPLHNWAVHQAIPII